MDIFASFYGESDVPPVNLEGFLSPFNNILWIFENFNFNQFSELFDKNFKNTSRIRNSDIAEFTVRVFNLDLEYYASSPEIINEPQGFRLIWKTEWIPNERMEVVINPSVVAEIIFRDELSQSFKLFKTKESVLEKGNTKEAYCLSSFKELNKILDLFYANKENYIPFEKAFGRFFSEFYSLTYPFLKEDSDFQHIDRVFKNIHTPRKPVERKENELSSIEKIVDILVEDGTLHTDSKNTLIEYLEVEINVNSIRWLDTADSFTQFIYALVSVQLYKEGSIPWKKWYNVVKFSKGKTIDKNTFKKLYYKAKNSVDTNPFISKINQSIAPPLG